MLRVEVPLKILRTREGAVVVTAFPPASGYHRARSAGMDNAIFVRLGFDVCYIDVPLKIRRTREESLVSTVFPFASGCRRIRSIRTDGD